MINEIIEHVREYPLESGLYAASVVYWSSLAYLLAKSFLFQSRNNIEDRLTEEKIFSGKK